MGVYINKLDRIEPIFREAMACNACFTCPGSSLRRALVDIAQVRPIGDDYWTSEMRIVLALLNPGAGKVSHSGPNQDFKHLLHAYADGSGSLRSVFQHQWSEMPEWGVPRGLFRRLYLEDGYGLNLNEIATANIAWCAELCDFYQSMLGRCFGKHTLPLLRELQPDVVLLAGDETHVFTSAIQDACHGVEIVCAMHYRAFNFLSPRAKQDHLTAVRDQLDRIRRTKRAMRVAAGDFRPLHASPISSGDNLKISRATSELRMSPPATEPASANISAHITHVAQGANRPNSASRFGPYKITNRNALLNRANRRSDPRWVFYDAMLELNRYEDYYSKFGDMKVYPETYWSSRRTAHTEMAWARKQGWVADA